MGDELDGHLRAAPNLEKARRDLLDRLDNYPFRCMSVAMLNAIIAVVDDHTPPGNLPVTPGHLVKLRVVSGGG